MNFGKIKSVLNNVLQSEWVVYLSFAFALVCNFFDAPNVSLPVLVIIILLTLGFCEDVKNIFAIILYAPFYIGTIVNTKNGMLYAIAVLTVVFAMVTFLVAKYIKLKRAKTLKIGEYFIPLCLCTLAYLLGGVTLEISRQQSLTVLMFSVASFVFYFMAMNCAKDLVKFFYKVFALGGIIVLALLYASNFNAEKGLSSLVDLGLTGVVGAENINVASIFIMLGMVGAFGLGLYKKHSGAYSFLAVLFLFSIYVTRCRTVIALASLGFILAVLYSFLRAPNKKIYAIYISAVLLLVAVYLLAFPEAFAEIIDILFGDISWSGRDVLWKWCIERFSSHPFFGIGFISNEIVPCQSTGAEKYVLAHNTIVQWLVSLGLLGTSLMVVASSVKFRIVMRGFFRKATFIRFAILLIALTGILDQAATMDPFIVNISILLIATIERSKRKDEIIK